MKGKVSLRTLSLIVFNIFMGASLMGNISGYWDFPKDIFVVILFYGNLLIIFFIKKEGR